MGDLIFDVKPQGKVLDAFYHDRSRCSFIRGPLGSGKTIQTILKILALMTEQAPNESKIRPSRWLAVRNTYPDLFNTTMKDWLAICGDLGKFSQGSKEPPNQKLDFDLDDGTRVVAEIIFLALDRPDDVKKLRGTQATGIWLNETKELSKEVVDMADLRHGRYPSMASGGVDCSWHGMVGDTNAPDDDHWYYQMAEKGSAIDWLFFTQPGGLIKVNGEWKPNPKAENLINLNQTAESREWPIEKRKEQGLLYYVNGMQNKKEQWIAVNLGNQYGSSFDGKPVYTEFNHAIHVKEFEFSKDLPICFGWDFGNCYDDKTEVLTESGFKFFKDLTDDDLVATRSPDGNLEYHKPKFRVNEPYKGEMLEWISREVNMCVTPDHLVACRDDHKLEELHFKSAQWLSEHNTGHWRVDTRSNWLNEGWVDPLNFGMPAEVFAPLLGLYLSEGSVEKVGNSYRISIYQKSQKEDMKNWIDTSKMNWKWIGDSKASGWRCTDNALGKWLHGFGKSYEKCIPREIAEMPKNCIELFIKAYTAGDGHIRIRNGVEEHTIYTASERMALGFHELAQKCGWSCSVLPRKGRVSLITEGGLSRSITSRDGYTINFKKTTKTAALHKRHFRKVDYDGRIYCVNVPYHTLYVRRGGLAHWNGNTPACVVGQLSPNGQLMIRHEFWSPDSGIHKFGTLVVRPYLAKLYKGYSLGLSVGDPAGNAKASTDEKTCINILSDTYVPEDPETGGAGIPTVGSHDKSNGIEARTGAVRGMLSRLIDGRPAIIIHPDCSLLIKGFNGGYQYERVKVSGMDRYRDQPKKDKFSHCHDALQYLALGITSGFAEEPEEDAANDYGTNRSRITGY